MTAARRRVRHAAWVPPGTLEVPADAAATRLRAFLYASDEFEERDRITPAEVAALRRPDRTLWVDVVGLADLATIEALGEIFDVHPLALEDVLHLGQRPKAERYHGMWFVTLRMHAPPVADRTEQVSLFVGEGWVLTFQEREGDCLETVRRRLRDGRRQIRARTASYLAYAIVDAIVDAYFPVVESLGDRLDELEAKILASADASLLAEVHGIRRQLTALRREVWPLREALASVLRDEDGMFEGVEPFLRDCHDHALRVLDLVEVQREMATGLGDLYMSALSNRMNEIMRTLTVIATVFIPLSFLAGVYGMNFDFMPELHWEWAYPALWGVMLAVAGGLLLWFRRRGWLG